MNYMHQAAFTLQLMAEWLGLQSFYVGIVALVVWAVIRASRIRHPAWQLALWWLVLLRLVLPLSIATPVSLRSGVELAATSLIGSHQTLQTAALQGWQPTAPAPVPVETLSTPSDKMRPKPAMTVTDILLGLIVTGWAMGVALLAIRAARASRNLMIWLSRAEEVQDPALRDWGNAWRHKLGVRRSVRLVTSDRAASFTTGVWHPVIHLPRDLVTQGDAVTLDAVIGHEMAHIHGLDALWLSVERCLAILFFFHPAVWFAVERISAARESLRDEMVVHHGEANARDYFAGIISAIRCMRTGSGEIMPPTLAVASVGRSAARLRERILWLKQASHTSTRTRLGAAAGVILLAAVLLPLAHAQNRPPRPTPPAHPPSAPRAPVAPKQPDATTRALTVGADDETTTAHAFSDHESNTENHDPDEIAANEEHAQEAQQQATEAGQTAAEAAQQAVQASQEAAQAGEAVTNAMRDVHVALAEAKRADHHVHVDIDVEGIRRDALLAASAGLKAAAASMQNAHLAENINRTVAKALLDASRQVTAARDKNHGDRLNKKMDADIRATLDQAARELERAAKETTDRAEQL